MDQFCIKCNGWVKNPNNYACVECLGLCRFIKLFIGLFNVHTWRVSFSFFWYNVFRASRNPHRLSTPCYVYWFTWDMLVYWFVSFRWYSSMIPACWGSVCINMYIRAGSRSTIPSTHTRIGGHRWAGIWTRTIQWGDEASSGPTCL